MKRIIGSIAVLALTASGCAAGNASSSEPPPKSTKALPAKVPAGVKLIVADQSEATQSAFRASGEIDKLPFDVEFANFVGGPAILEAFRAGAADLGGVGDTPPIQAHAAGEQVPIVAALRRTSRTTRLAIAPGVDLETLEDLRGKRIAYAPGTAQQAIVLRALDKAGLKLTDVELIRLQLSEFPDAIRNNQVDVAPLGEPNLTRYLHNYKDKGASVLPARITNELATGLSYVYVRREVLEDPAKAAAVRSYVEHWIRAQHWINEHPEEWLEFYYLDNQKLDRAAAEPIVAANGLSGFPRLRDLVPVQQRTIDLIRKSGEFTDRLDAAAEFDLRFDDVIQPLVGKLGASTTPRDRQQP